MTLIEDVTYMLRGYSSATGRPNPTNPTIRNYARRPLNRTEGSASLFSELMALSSDENPIVVAGVPGRLAYGLACKLNEDLSGREKEATIVKGPRGITYIVIDGILPELKKMPR